MKHRRKIRVLALTLTMVFSLIGCGSSTTPVLNENVEEKDGDEIADTLEEGASVDEIVDRIQDEIEEGEAVTTDKPTETSTNTPKPTVTPTSTATPTATPEPTATPTPEPHVHDYKETVTVQPTCATAGEKTLTCECGDVKAESIPATGNHSWVEGTTVVHHEALGHVEEVQVQVGTSETRHEYACNYPSCSERFDTPEAKSEHCLATGDFNHAMCSTIIYDYPGEPIYDTQSQWVVDQPAWDEVVGTGTYTCSVCGATK